jgi:hypothetical protein
VGESAIVPIIPDIPRHIALVDASWTNALASIGERVKALKIVDATTAQMASDLQRRVTDAGKQLEKARKELKEPFLAAGRAIDAAASKPEATIARLKSDLQDGITAFTVAEAARIAKIEADRQAEIKRLQAIADAEKKRQDELAAKLAEEARINAEADAREKARAEAENEKKRLAGLPMPLDLGLDDDEPEEPVAPPPPIKSEAQIALEAALHAPVAVAAKIAGSAMRVTLEIASVDVTQLPEPFVERIAKMQAIRSTYTVGWKEGNVLPVCPGVVFEIKRTPVSTKQRI